MAGRSAKFIKSGPDCYVVFFNLGTLGTMVNVFLQLLLKAGFLCTGAGEQNAPNFFWRRMLIGLSQFQPPTIDDNSGIIPFIYLYF